MPLVKTIDQGSATTFDTVRDSAPEGLAGYEDGRVRCQSRQDWRRDGRP